MEYDRIVYVVIVSIGYRLENVTMIWGGAGGEARRGLRHTLSAPAQASEPVDACWPEQGR